MTAHVAEATEDRGRVILRCTSWSPNEVAIKAALVVAGAFNSEVELLFVEDDQRLNFASFPFAKEISLRNGKSRRVSQDAVRAEVRGSFQVARQHVADMSSSLEINVYEHVVRDDPVQALVSACARRGPWNVIAIAETFGTPAPFSLVDVFDAVSDATGVLVVGPEARQSAATTALRSANAKRDAVKGPVVIAVEDGEHLQGMLRAGHVIAAALATEVVILLVSETDAELVQLDAEVRLVLADQDNVRLAKSVATHQSRMAVAEAIRRLQSSFVIAQFGAAAAPRHQSLRPLTSTLQCPLLLVR